MLAPSYDRNSSLPIKSGQSEGRYLVGSSAGIPAGIACQYQPLLHQRVRLTLRKVHRGTVQLTQLQAVLAEWAFQIAVGQVSVPDQSEKVVENVVDKVLSWDSG